MGILTIDGSIDVAQFWPLGGSDADTTKILVTVRKNSFRYQTDSGAKRITHVFEKAQYDDRGKLKPLVRADNTVVVRLQGIDAPELHYRPTPVKGKKLAGTGLVKEYRQNQAETATVRLGTFLRTYGASSVPALFRTWLDDERGPAEAVDKYGRFVGNICLKDKTDVNLWLLGRGLAAPGLYNSMTDSEIRDCLAQSAKGRKARGGIVRHYSRRILPFQPKTLYRRPTQAAKPAVMPEGAGRFLLPKIFRRQVNWWANARAGNIRGTLVQFMQVHGARDFYYLTEEFLRDGRTSARPRKFFEIVRNGVVSSGPEEIVFKEDPSAIYASGARRREIKKWDFAM